MILLVDCPGCGKELKIDSKHAGTHGNCNHCRTRLLVPDPVLVAAIHLITTGKIPTKCEILEIAGIQFHLSSGTVTDMFVEKVRPEKSIPGHITSKTGLAKEDLASARPIRHVMADFLAWLSKQRMVAAHDATLQKRFLQAAMKHCDNVTCEVGFVDLESWAAVQDPAPEDVSLKGLGESIGVAYPIPMRALGCAAVSVEIFRHYCDLSDDLGEDLLAHRVKDVNLEPPAWRSDPASEAQIDYLFSLGHVATEGLTKGEASDLISGLVDGDIEPDFEVPY